MKVEESINYTKKLLDILQEHNQTVHSANTQTAGNMEDEADSKEIPMIKILNARAYYACVLTLSEKSQCRNDGYDEYEEVMKEATTKYGEFDSRTIGFHCYFGLHFVQISDWNKVHQHFDHILNLKDRKMEVFEIRTVNQLMTKYMERVLDLEVGSNEYAVFRSVGGSVTWLLENGWALHERQLRFMNEINADNGESKAAGDHSVGFGVNLRGNECDRESYGKVNVLKVLVLHIRIFMFCDQNENALRILRDVLVQSDGDWIMNTSSTLLASYLEVIGVDEIDGSDIDTMKGFYNELTQNGDLIEKETVSATSRTETLLESGTLEPTPPQQPGAEMEGQSEPQMAGPPTISDQSVPNGGDSVDNKEGNGNEFAFTD